MLGVLLASVGLFALASSGALAECSNIYDYERVCTGALTVDQFQYNRDGPTYTFEKLTTEKFDNPSTTTNVITYDVNTEVTNLPFATLFNFNVDEQVDIEVTSNPMPVISVVETVAPVRGGANNSGSGNRSGVGGDNGAEAGAILPTISQLTANVTSTTPSGNPATLSFSAQAGSGGVGGSGTSTGFGDGYGGAGGIGGQTYGFYGQFTDVNVTGDSSNGQPNPNGGIGFTNIGGAGGNGGKGQASDYTGGGGPGGDGGGGITEESYGELILKGETAVTSQSFGVNLSSTGGAGGIGGFGENVLTGTARGGNGGKGGYGGDLTLSVTGTSFVVNTVNGSGIFVESLAGSGGAGGNGTSGGNAYGGNGGVGGTAGSVTITNTATAQSISTSGDDATGIHVRSHGGAGGDGGNAKADFGKGSGGAESGSGPGGAVSLSFGGSVSTSGAGSDAVMAHSVGGYKGSAGSAKGFVSYGAGGQSAGAGGPVTVTYAGESGDAITTTGDNSDGIFVQSLGGGGGKGGSTSGIVSLSGSGSAGGNGGTVSVTTGGDKIQTFGERSRGVVAKSTGGGGGDGGSARGAVSIGGSGSRGGSGGDVTLTNRTEVITAGTDAIGLLAQSVGGGGGNASSTSGLDAIGGLGGSGATGGTVTVGTDRSVMTSGTHAHAIFAHSIGGSGGLGSSAVSGAPVFSMVISGSGGTGNDGGGVKVTAGSSVILTTNGAGADGILAQSVGGGGGNAGNDITGAVGGIGVSLGIGKDGGSAGDGGPVTIEYTGAVSTTGDYAPGIAASSTGGMGGSAGMSISAGAGAGAVSIAMGGSGSGGGGGDTVTVCRGTRQSAVSGLNACVDPASDAGMLGTKGDAAPGLYAASTGGGGGHSNTVVSGSAGFGVDVAVGGDGGAGGVGGPVNVLSTGGITTSKNASPAIVAKSVGGSGGSSYLAGSVGTVSGATLGVTVGGSGGRAKGSGAVGVYSADTISTSGDGSDGITAVSQAGSGGVGGVALAATGVSPAAANVSVGGAGGGGGVAGDAFVTWVGETLTTKGTNAPGITALSSGGSGGLGGYAISATGGAFASADVSVGGKGGAGGTAGTATVTTASGSVSTTGANSDGITAISQGGNGGRGGGAITGDALSQASAAFTLGGGGGSGGTAKAATVTSNGSVTTSGANSFGIYAVSQGGNGGRGGIAVEQAMNLSFSDGYPTGGVKLTLGGEGGSGGTASTVNVTSNGSVTTNDINSGAIVAQSIGGSGGAGGVAYSGSANIDSTYSADVTVTVGGGGGTGGKADDVTVTNAGPILTKQANSAGVYAQSVGGNGGNGGASYNTLLNLSSNNSAALNFNVVVGGKGSTGGTPGTVTVTNSDTITTTSTASSGIYAQSIGGHGGNGGAGGTAIVTVGEKKPEGATQVAGNLSITVGGEGGDGAESKSVTVTNTAAASITTGGGGSHGIFAQSVGGHGGDGGLASTYTFTFTGKCDLTLVGRSKQCNTDDPEDPVSMSGSLDLTFGNDGGTGLNADTVTVHNDGSITTTGDVSYGVLAQSIGGGGGNGGAATDDLSAFTSNATANDIAGILDDLTNNGATAVTSLSAWTDFNFFIGGQGGAAGDGEAVTVTDNGSITTSGTNSYGIFAQSIGGGGGSGGAASEVFDTHTVSVGGSGSGGGDGGDITLSGETLQITTKGYGAAGILAQSIGAGGGDAGSKGQVPVDPILVNIQVGGKSGVSGNGGIVQMPKPTASVGDSITTEGAQSPGIFLQSIGGGGGTTIGGTQNAATTSSLLVGGSGGASGSGNMVSLNFVGTIETGKSVTSASTNAASHGIIAQSIGGGGGYAGSVVMGSSSRFGSGVSTDSADASGSGASVDVSYAGNLTTHGAGSVGILAQSVGGGGGVKGNTDNQSTNGAYLGSFGGSGTAGAVGVSVGSGASISTTGAGAHGIFAQSAGGNGTSLSSITSVDVTVDGDVSATGTGAIGIFAGATGDGKGPISITVTDGATVTGGSNASGTNAGGVYVKGGNGAKLTNAGTITNVDGAAGIAVVSDGADLVIDNTGTITGSQPAFSSITLLNRSGGVIESGEVLDADLFYNQGALRIGGAGRIGATTVSGDLTQAAAGVTEVDLDIGRNRADSLFVGGLTRLGGTLTVRPVSYEVGPEKRQSLKILTALGGLDYSELALTPSVVAQYGLRAGADSTLRLDYDVDFRNDSILTAANDNQDEIARHLHSVYRSGALDQEVAKALIEIQDIGTYTQEMNDLSAELYLDGALVNIRSNLRFTETLLSCADSDTMTTFSAEGRCSWMAFTGRRIDRDASSDNLGFEADTFQIAAGFERALDDGWTVGAGLSYEDHRIDVDDSSAYSDGAQYQGGVSAKRTDGPWEFAGALGISYGTLDNHRFPVGSGGLETDQDVWSATGMLRASHIWSLPVGYLKPWAGLGVTAQSRDGVQEDVGEVAALSISSENDTYGHVNAGVEWGLERALASGGAMRGTLRAGLIQFLGNPSVSSDVRLSTSPDSVGTFQTSTGIDATHLAIDAGLDLFTKDNVAFRANLGASVSDNTVAYGGSIRAEIRF